MKYLLIIFVVLFFFGCGENKVNPSINPALNDKEIPAQESWNSTVIFSDSGRTVAILHAGHILMFTKSHKTLLDDNIKIDFYNERQLKTTTLTAKRGRVNDLTKDLFAIDSVVAVSDSGVVLRTEKLMWNNETRKIMSDKFVTITSPKEKIEGYGFQSDQNLSNYTIYDITYITKIDTVTKK